MLRILFGKSKRVVVSLRFTILGIFITLFVAAMLIALGISYFRYSETVSYVAFRLMKEASNSVIYDIEDEAQDVAIACDFSAHLINETLDPKYQQDLADYTFNMMQTESKTLPSMQSIFWGDETGSFVMSGVVDNGTISTEMINRMITPATHIIHHRDLMGKIIRHESSTDFKYDPRTTPWYLLAKNTGKIVWTDIFPYQTGGLLGITVAVPVYKNNQQLEGVFAINVRLDYLRHFIESLKISKHGIIFIVNRKGEVITFPHLAQHSGAHLVDIHSLAIPWLVESFERYLKKQEPEFIFNYDGENYLAIYKPITYMLPHGWLIGVVAPEDDFIGQLIKTNLITIGICLIILMIGVVAMSSLVTRIITPMKRLVSETEKIKHFELKETPHIQSNIKEVIALSNGIFAMKQGLRTFQKYVPATLVRKLIETGQDVIVGGEKKQLAIFFSDIQDFTPISEKMDPQELMEYICEYLTVMTHIITEERGTIDKYIGDSVMAFWGAPLPEKNPCEKAAEAALNCIQHLQQLNVTWKEQGRIPLHTRIGLHFGEAIVGNVGSEERINYTAVGDAINATSRLEGINKIYGSTIAVSDAFYQTIKNKFIFRLLDCVAVKGKEQSFKIYELLAKLDQQISFDLSLYQQFFLSGFEAYQKADWQNAISYFKKCVTVYTGDTVAPVFIKRCEGFIQNPPKEWDGIWRLGEK